MILIIIIVILRKCVRQTARRRGYDKNVHWQIFFSGYIRNNLNGSEMQKYALHPLPQIWLRSGVPFLRDASTVLTLTLNHSPNTSYSGESWALLGGVSYCERSKVILRGPGPNLTPGLNWRKIWQSTLMHLSLELTIENAAFVTGLRTVLHLMTFSKWCEKILTFLLENL